MKLKKKIYIMLICVSMAFIFGGCGAEEIEVDNIVEILPSNILAIPYNDVQYPGEFVSMELIERDTNKLRGEDNIKVCILIKNDYFECKKYVEISLNYENKEWIIEKCNDYEIAELVVLVEPPLSEKSIVHNLPQEITSIVVDKETIPMEIASFEVEKRKTDVHEKTDQIWCTISLSNEYYEYVKYVTLTYSYYDVKGGWILDNWWEDTTKMTYKVKKNPINESRVLADIEEWINDRTFNISLQEHVEDFENSKIEYKINVIFETEYYKRQWIEVFTYYFNGYSWIKDNQSGPEASEWNIIGKYYIESEEQNRAYFYMEITDFDPVNQTVKGYCSFEYDNPQAYKYNSNYYELDDKKVVVNTSNLKILIDNVGNYAQTDIYFDYRSARANYDRYWVCDIYRY